MSTTDWDALLAPKKEEVKKNDWEHIQTPKNNWDAITSSAPKNDWDKISKLAPPTGVFPQENELHVYKQNEFTSMPDMSNVPLPQKEGNTITRSIANSLLGKPGVSPSTPAQQAADVTLSTLEEAAKPYHELAKGMATPLVGTTSVPLNVVSGIPGAIASVPTEFYAQMVENLPLDLALRGVGKIAGKIGEKVAETPAWQGLKDVLRENVPVPVQRAFVYRGGIDPQSRAAFSAFDTEGNKINMAQEEMANVARGIGEKGFGKGFTKQEQELVTQLVQQPFARNALQQEAALGAKRAAQEEIPTLVGGPSVPTNLNNPGNLFRVPGLRGPKEAEQFSSVFSRKRYIQPFEGGLTPEITIPETTRPMNEFADAADYLAYKLNMSKQALRKVEEVDSTFDARFSSGNYTPQYYAQPVIKTIAPSVQSREAAAVVREKLMMRKGADVGTFEKEVIKDPVAMAVQYGREMNIANQRQLQSDLASLPGVVLPATKETVAEAAGMQSWQVKNIPGMGNFVKMPEGEMALGELGGRLVREAEAREIMGVHREFGNMYQKAREIFSWWRFGATVINPKTVIRNFYSNATQAHVEGLPFYRLDIYKEAKDTFVKKSNVYYNELHEAGAPWLSGRGSRFSELFTPEMNDGNILMTSSRAMYNFVKNNKFAASASKFYGDIEGYFKTAVYIAKRKAGMDVPDAIKAADVAIGNYDQVPMWVKRVRSSPMGIPFITFTYLMAPKVVKTALTQPQAFLHLKLFVDSMNSLSMQNLRASREEMDDIDRLYKGKIITIWPERDAQTGSIMVYPIERNTFFSDFIPGRKGVAGAVGEINPLSIPANLVAKNPMYNLGIAAATGYDVDKKRQAFPSALDSGMLQEAFGRAGVGQDSSFPDEAAQAADSLFKQGMQDKIVHSIPLVSSLVPAYRAAQGIPAMGGRTTSIGEALMGGILTGPRARVDEDRRMSRILANSAVKKGQAFRMQQATQEHQNVSPIKKALAGAL